MATIENPKLKDETTEASIKSEPFWDAVAAVFDLFERTNMTFKKLAYAVIVGPKAVGRYLASRIAIVLLAAPILAFIAALGYIAWSFFSGLYAVNFSATPLVKDISSLKWASSVIALYGCGYGLWKTNQWHFRKRIAKWFAITLYIVFTVTLFAALKWSATGIGAARL